MYHYTYIILDPNSSDYYIGKHSTNNLKDGYLGSGTWPAQMKSENKELTKIIINLYETSEEAYNAEKILIGDKWKTDINCKNMKPGGKNSFFEKDTYSEYCKNKWNVSHHMKSKEFLSESNFKFPFCSKEIQDKVDKTIKMKYNGRGSGSQEIKKRVEKTNLIRYGEKHTLNTENVKSAREKVIYEKFGTDNPFKNPEKLADIMEKRYGYRNPMYNEEIRAKHKKSMEEKDWTDRNKKSKETNLKRYGVTVAANSPEIREKNKRPCPFGCKNNHRFDTGNFSNHMMKIHYWTKDQILEFKNENKTN